MLSIINNEQKLTMSSREIAELTGKKHSHVMRDVRKMLLELEEDESIFGSIYLDNYKREKPMYDLTRKHTDCLLTGYSAKARMKVIERWHELESTPKEDPIVLLAQKVLQQNAEIKHLEKTKAHINDKRTATVMGKLGAATKKIKSLESKFQDVGTRLSLKGAKLPERIDTEFKLNVQTWRVLKQLSLDMNQTIEKVEDSNYGSVNTYHIDVIEAFKSEYL